MTHAVNHIGVYESPEIFSPDLSSTAPNEYVPASERPTLYVVPELVEEGIKPELASLDDLLPRPPVRPTIEYRHGGEEYSREDLVLFAKQHRDLYPQLVPDPMVSLSYTAPGVRKRSVSMDEQINNPSQETIPTGTTASMEKSSRVSAAQTAVSALMAECGVRHGQSLYNNSGIKDL